MVNLMVLRHLQLQQIRAGLGQLHNFAVSETSLWRAKVTVVKMHLRMNSVSLRGEKLLLYITMRYAAGEHKYMV